MTEAAAGYCWIEVDAQVQGPTGPPGPPGPQGQGPDTLFGHGIVFPKPDGAVLPVDDEGAFSAATGQAYSFNGVSGQWEPHIAMDGDEYVDMDTGIVYPLEVGAEALATSGTPTAQRTFVVPLADFDLLPAGARSGDVVLSDTGGRARIIP
jgi:hypothetical protein